MKKYFLSILIILSFIFISPINTQKVSAADVSIKDFINLLISIGVIPPDKVPAVNIWLASLSSPSSPTVVRSSGGGGGGGSSRNYNVFYNGNSNTGGAVPTDSTNYRRNTTVTVLGNTNFLTKTGYSFYSWNTQADGQGVDYLNSSTLTINSDVVLYAKWIATYTVTYDGNSNSVGSVPVDSSQYSSDVSVTILDIGDLAKENYRFNGWNTHSDGSGYDYAASSSATIFVYQENVTLYAQWVRQYTITYDRNGGTGPVPTIGSYDLGTVVSVSNPNGLLSRSNYVFNGWNTQADGLGTDYATSSTITVASDTVLYAKWLSTVLITNPNWNVSPTGQFIDFYFTAEAFSENVDVLATDIIDSAAGTATIIDTASTPETTTKGILTHSSGDVVTPISDGFTLISGDIATFRIRYLISGINGTWSEITITSVAGQDIAQDYQVSPTATINID